MRITSQQNKDFVEAILPNFPLDMAVDWINGNMDPEDVFTEDKLTAWAEGAGFTQQS